MEPLEKMSVDVHLDEGLITEILVRLPARSVLRFRAVCKDWLRITSCPSFAPAHASCRPLEVLLCTRTTVVRRPELSDAAAPRWPGNWPPPFQRRGSPFPLDSQEAVERYFTRWRLPRPDAAVYLELDALSVTAHRPARRRLARYQAKGDVELPWPCEYQQRFLLASRDGLLLFRSGAIANDVEKYKYLVCNPVTRQWSNLPLLRSDARSVVHRESGFYFHEPSGEFRLLCHVTFYLYYQPHTVDWSYYVFSTGADEPRRLNTKATPMWNTIVTALPDDPSRPLKSAFYDNLMTPAVLHGQLHWMQHMEGGLTDDQMVAFDTVTETFRRMPPPPMTRKDPVHSHLLVADGSLMAAELGHLFVDLWVLEGYDGGAAPGRWERWHRVSVEVPCHRDNRLLLATGGDGGDVILGTPGGVVAYNVRSGTVRQVVDIDVSRVDTVSPSRVVFRESLVRHGFFDARPHPGLPLFSFRA